MQNENRKEGSHPDIPRFCILTFVFLQGDSGFNTLQGEYHRVRVNTFFERFLDRPADPGELAYFAGELDSGLTDEEIITQLISSEEYYDRVQV